MLTAEQARKKVDYKAPARIKECAIKKALKEIDKLVRDAARDGETETYCPIYAYPYVEELIRTLADLGYQIESSAPGIVISWEKTNDKS